MPFFIGDNYLIGDTMLLKTLLASTNDHLSSFLTVANSNPFLSIRETEAWLGNLIIKYN